MEYGMKISWPVHVQNVLMSTIKHGINLILRGETRDVEKQTSPTK